MADIPVRPPGVRAFTMVEVAISLAVIGFALVAIIGILPAGLNVQKENREETIINQDVSIWMDAIRSGAEGMDYLTNYVDGIEIIRTPLDSDGLPLAAGRESSTFTVKSSLPNAGWELLDGYSIIGLLTTPRYVYDEFSGSVYSNHVVAYVRAISGGATDKVPQDNSTVLDAAFAYRLTCGVIPFYASDPNWTNYAQFSQVASAGSGILSTNEIERVQTIAKNLYEIRLAFEWPLRPPVDNSFDPPVATRVGNSRQVFRVINAGGITNIPTGLNSPPLAHYFFLPGNFEKARIQ